MVKGLKAEPGSNMSVAARARMCAGMNVARLFGLKDGKLAMARISPLRGFTTTTEPERARSLTISLRSAR